MNKFIVGLVGIVFLMSCGNGKDEGNQEGYDSLATSGGMAMSPDQMEMKEMMERKQSEAPIESPYKDAKIDVRVFNNDTVKGDSKIVGFGYNIFIFDALYVHQPHIPAINGNRGFKSMDQARVAAEFVVHKIRNNIMPPSLSVQELDSLGTLK